MRNEKIKEYASKIDITCCDHHSGRNRYLLGYTGFRCCKVVMCLDCDRVQYVGGKIGKALYPTAHRLFFGRIDIIGAVDVTE